jgi:endonuclease YncB( thermonuclease family)
MSLILRSAFVFLAFVGIVMPASAETLVGKVVGVSDVDTVTVLDVTKTQHKIRLAGIDAPEKSQPFGNRSKENLSDLVFGKTVTVEHSKIDRYGRIVGKILVNGTNANMALIRTGMAWHYKEYEREQSATDRATYAAAETIARQQRAGLWRDANPTPPWDFRRAQRDGANGNANAETEKGATPITALNSQCPCGGSAFCTGERGGQFCLRPNGKKKYL